MINLKSIFGSSERSILRVVWWITTLILIIITIILGIYASKDEDYKIPAIVIGSITGLSAIILGVTAIKQKIDYTRAEYDYRRPEEF